MVKKMFRIGIPTVMMIQLVASNIENNTNMSIFSRSDGNAKEQDPEISFYFPPPRYQFQNGAPNKIRFWKDHNNQC